MNSPIQGFSLLNSSNSSGSLKAFTSSQDIKHIVNKNQTVLKDLIHSEERQYSLQRSDAEVSRLSIELRDLILEKN